MHFENDAIVELKGPMHPLLRIGYVVLGLLLLLGPAFIAASLLKPEHPSILLLSAAASYALFAFGGIAAIRAANVPRYDLRLDPVTGLATLTTYRLRSREIATRPLRDLGPCGIEPWPLAGLPEHFTLHVRIAQLAPVRVDYFATEEDARLWARRIEALRLAAQ